MYYFLIEDGTFVTNNTNNVQMEIEKGQFYTQLITLPSLSDGGTIKLETHGIIIEAVRDVKGKNLKVCIFFLIVSAAAKFVNML